MKRKLLLVLAIVVVVAACAALIACGGGGGGGESAGEKTFVIGIGGPFTDGAVDFGRGAKRAVELAVKQANESDEAKDLGITFTTMDGDDQSNPDKANPVATAFVSNRDLVGVIGHFNTGVSVPASQVYNENNVVQIAYGATGVALTEQGFANVFRTCARDDSQGPAAAESAINLGFKKAYIVDDSSPYGQGIAEEFEKKYVELGGEVLGKESTQQGQSDFAPVVTKIRSLGPDVVFFGGTYDAPSGAGALFAKQLADGGVDAPIMGGDGIREQSFIDEAGAGAEGSFATLPGDPIEQLAQGQAFIDAYTDMFPGETPGGFDANAYDAANALIKAVYKVATADGLDSVTTPAGREALIAAVAATNFEGVTGVVSFDAKGDTNNQSVTTYRVEDGAWVPVEF